MQRILLFSIVLSITLLVSCGDGAASNKQIVVTNTMDSDRAFETVSVTLASLDLQGTIGSIVLNDADTGEALVTQLYDSDGDGKMDAILFQPEVAANGERIYEISISEDKKETDSIPACYSRFVPERTDDYAWENNRVAFRTYGPTAQKMKEDSVPGGTLSSGMDAWLKRVDYPIIEKWYQKELQTDGTYHEDTGEGLDNFHVGVSRGVGGIAKKVDTVYYSSKNFTEWKTLANGPLRTSFELSYGTWDSGGNALTEKKRISLDYGSNLSRFEILIQGTDTISAGLTLHEKDGTIGVDPEGEWVSYWEPHDDSELGTAIVVPNDAMVGHEHYVTDRVDESNLYAHIAKKEGAMVYYAGFGWKKSGQFDDKDAWEAYVDRFAERLQNPLVVTIK